MFKRIISKLFITLIVLNLFSIVKVNAAGLTVQISDLPEYENTQNFKLTYTALQVDSQPVTARFYYQLEGDSWKTLKNEVIGETGSVETDGGAINKEGRFNFKVIASNSGETVESQTTTIVDWSAPGAPSEYSKQRLNSNTYRLKWKNTGDSDFSHVLIYHSQTQNFTADENTLVGAVGGNKDTVIVWEDTGLEIGKDYYYAIRTVDFAGNASGTIGDGGTVNEVIVYPTQSAGGVEKVTKLPVEKSAGQGNGQVLGEEKDTATPSATESSNGSADLLSKGEQNRNILILVFLLLAGMGFFLAYRRRNPLR